MYLILSLLFSNICQRSLAVLIEVASNRLFYLDPGSGSFILQVLLATFLASLLFIKTFWNKIISRLKKPASEEQEGYQDIDDQEHDVSK